MGDGGIPEHGGKDLIAKKLRHKKLEKWARRLHRDGIDPTKIEMLSPKEGMEKSYHEIMKFDNFARNVKEKVYRR